MGILQVLRLKFQKFRILEILNFHPCCHIYIIFQLDFRSPPGYDRTRGVEIGNKNFELTHLEEAYTSEHWLVRIYKVKDLDNRTKIKAIKPVKKSRKKSSKKVCTFCMFFRDFPRPNLRSNIGPFPV